MSKFLAALRIHLRVVISLFLRETRASFGNSLLGYLWAILTPAAGVALLVIVFSFASRQPPFGQSLALFFATGFLTLSFFNKLTNSLMSSYDANKALLLYPIVKQYSVIISRLILVSLTYVIIQILFYGSLIIFGLASPPSDILLLIYANLIIALLGLGIGLLNLCLILVWDSWKYVWQILNRPLFFISGVFFIPSLLSDNFLIYLKWNPVLHLIEIVRNAYYPNYDSRVLSINYLIILSFITILLGLFFERVARKN